MGSGAGHGGPPRFRISAIAVIVAFVVISARCAGPGGNRPAPRRIPDRGERRHPHRGGDMSERLATAKAYEAALFAGRMDEVAGYLTEDATYWVAGAPPLGGTWRGPAAIVRAFERREFGLGAADWGYEEVWRDWYEADDRVIVEIRERSWLRHAPEDVMDARTCVVLRFRDGRIHDMRDYTDAYLYEAFLARHRAHLPKFAGDAGAATA
jgi:ketosteroid isomerase-like protein